MSCLGPEWLHSQYLSRLRHDWRWAAGHADFPPHSPKCPSKLSQGIAYAKSYCHQVNHTFNKVQRSWFINLGNAPSWSFQTPWFKAWQSFRRHNNRGLRSMAMTTVAGCYGHLSWVPLHIHQCFGGVLTGGRSAWSNEPRPTLVASAANAHDLLGWCGTFGLFSHILGFPYIIGIISPTDFDIFQRSRSTTNQWDCRVSADPATWYWRYMVVNTPFRI